MLTNFRPILAGAGLRDRVIGSLGGMIGIAATVAVLWLPGAGSTPLVIAAPIGASAVLLFAVPASPMAQPWPVIGGNTLSAFVGVVAARSIPSVPVAAGVAVGVAILAMSLARCLHPPGGATALTAVIGGQGIQALGFAFPFTPVALDAALLTATAVIYHRWSGHTYPHHSKLVIDRGARGPAPAPHPGDLDLALADLGETFDISRADLELLIERVDHHARVREATRASR